MIMPQKIKTIPVQTSIRGYIIVEIPSCQQHGGHGWNLKKYKIRNTCPSCGMKRAIKHWKGLSYDGSRRLHVDCWENECGHIDLYSMIREEGKIVPSYIPSITQIPSEQENKQNEKH